jgi:predicted translin family RNA/ssDNA-binding protein
VIQQAQGSDVDPTLLRELQYRVEIASGSFPEAKELRHRLDQQVTSLKEAQDAAKEAKRRSEVLQDAFEKLVKDLPLPSDTQKARQNLVEAIHDNREISSPVSNFVDTLDDSLKKLDLDWDTFYEEKIGEDAWRSLDPGIKQRLISAANYVSLAKESGYDFGPAVLALSSGLERLLDINIVNPLYQEIKYQPDSNKIVNESPVSDFRRVTLGQIPYLLGVKNNLGESNYRKVLDRWLNKNFSNEELSYLSNELGASIETIQPVRNEWAHGSTVVNEKTYNRCESKLIDKRNNPFSVFS